MKKLFLVVNEDVFFLSHRKNIALAAVENGYDVTIITHNSGKKSEIQNLGLKFIDLPINSTGTNVFEEIYTFLFLIFIYLKEKPDLVHHVGLKTILWGGLAARIVNKFPYVNAISGLGSCFNKDKKKSLKRIIITFILKIIHVTQSSFIIFQNNEDKNIFLDNGIIKDNKVFYIKGSGVDLNGFKYIDEPKQVPLKIVFTGRMIKEKGVLIVIEAANLLKNKYEQKIQFLLCGDIHKNPSSLKKQELEALCDGNYIKWLGFCSDIKSILETCHIMVFPSYYREGLPKSIIDAEAIGLPIITTNSVGCKDTVVDGYNGYLIPKQNSQILAEKIEYLINNSQLRLQMRLNSRKFAEKNFSLQDVIQKHLDIYSIMLNNSSK